MKELLSQKLDEYEISSRVGPGNKKLMYLEGWRGIEIANTIFGPNGWADEVIDIGEDFCESSPGDKWTIGISALVRVTLKDGCFHEVRILQVFVFHYHLTLLR